MGATLKPYRNPLRDVTRLQAERIDAGVDYAGWGPVFALGPGRITSTRDAGWPGGSFIGERLSEAPLKGRYGYAAESISPYVRVGQKVEASTGIGERSAGGLGTGVGGL